jgi:hypothetical protein
MTAVSYPMAFTFATLLAISSARASERPFFAEIELTPPFWVFVLFFILLGGASLLFGILNPETMALMGMDGIVSP